MANKVNINDLNLLRVFALSMVVLRHSFAPFVGIWGLDEVYETSYYAKILGEYVSTISMPLYVFISGILFSFLRNSLKKYPTYKILFQKKFRRLIRPYLFLAPLYIFFFTEVNNVEEFFLKFWKGAGHLWFLIMIFVVFLIFYPFEEYFKKHMKRGFVLMIVLYCLNPVLWYFGLYPLSLAFKYIPFFYAGYIFFYNSDNIISFLDKKLFLLILLHTLLFAITYLIFPYYTEGKGLSAWFEMLMFVPMGILSVSFIFILFSKIGTLSNKFLNNSIKNINDMSYYIYIFHQPLLMIFFDYKFLRSWDEPFLILIAFSYVFLTALLLSNMVMKFKIGRKLIGAH